MEKNTVARHDKYLRRAHVQHIQDASKLFLSAVVDAVGINSTLEPPSCVLYFFLHVPHFKLLPFRGIIPWSDGINPSPLPGTRLALRSRGFDQHFGTTSSRDKKKS